MKTNGNNTSSVADLIEMSGRDKQVRHKKTGPRLTKFHKVSARVCCVMGTFITWLIVSGPIVLFIVQTFFSNRNITFNLTAQIPPINASNSSNYSIQTIHCENNFVYEPSEFICYPPCNWHPTSSTIVTILKSFTIITDVIGLVISAGTFVGWGVATYLEFKSKKGYTFQLSRASLYMVVLSSIGIFVLSLIIDALGREQLMCSRTRDGDIYLRAHLIRPLNTDNKLLVNILGGFYHFFFLSTFIWIALAFINILAIILLSTRFTHTLKTELTLFLIEILVATVLPLCVIAIAIGTSSETAYIGNYLLQQIFVPTVTGVFCLYAIIIGINSGVILTLSLIILTKLRLAALRSKEKFGKKIQLTELEKRLLAYAIIISIAFIATVLSLQVFIWSQESYFGSITNYTVCVNVRSPITLRPRDPANTSLGNSSSLMVFRENTRNSTDCGTFLAVANEVLPVWFSFLGSFLVRSVYLIVFIILIPICTCGCSRRTKYSQNKTN